MAGSYREGMPEGSDQRLDRDALLLSVAAVDVLEVREYLRSSGRPSAVKFRKPALHWPHGCQASLNVD